MKSIAVLGGGIAGLSSAFFLSKAFPHAHVHIYESSYRVGGWIRTSRIPTAKSQSVIFESGPRTIRPRGFDGWITLDLVRQLKLTPLLLTVSKSHPSSRNRFIYHRGQLLKLPATLVGAICSLVSPHFYFLMPSAFLEPLRTASTSTDKDESVDSFFTRRFGTQVSQMLISALVHGIYAGDSTKLSMQALFPSLVNFERTYGSIIAGMICSPFEENNKIQHDHIRTIRKNFDTKELNRLQNASVWSLQGGLETLTLTLQNHLQKLPNVKFSFNSNVTQLIPVPDGDITISTSQDKATFTHVISALPSNELSRLCPDLPSLPEIEHASVGVVNFAFDPATVTLPIQGFGYLIPAITKPNPHGVLGVVVDSDVMPEIDGDNLVKITVMMGGRHWADKDINMIDSISLKQQALESVITHFNLPSSIVPIASDVHINRNCIPQYTVGHIDRMNKLHQTLIDKEGSWRGRLSLIGSSYAGVGVNDIVGNAFQLVESLECGKQCSGLDRLVPIHKNNNRYR